MATDIFDNTRNIPITQFTPGNETAVAQKDAEIERLRKRLSEALQEIDQIKRSREQERDYADTCYENERLRALLHRWQFDVGGAMVALERETLAAINAKSPSAAQQK